MKIAVTDTNIFIELIKAGLLPSLFQIGYTIHTTYEVVNELLPEQKSVLNDFIRDKKLIIYSFSASEITDITKQNLSPGLSFVDQGIFYYAQNQHDYFILTNDNLLRKTCKNSQIEVHGILWLMDLFLQKDLCTKPGLCQALKRMMQGFNRLPINECTERLNKWGQS
ncbi:PIN domain-containing protein [Dyadobacter tibetensis]|uniref:PIN domain-containing protein n=1 Tax=Dyadobacter tibetensis TaxID=1211851 RepID=UPI00046FDF4B|nr:PIN domain-containing protein [Dyadobacter tibetensis]